MKILNQRYAGDNWSMKVDCSGYGWHQENAPCTSNLEIDANDLLKREWSKYPDESGIAYGFVCPLCNCFTEIQLKIDDNIKKLAKPYQDKK